MIPGIVASQLLLTQQQGGGLFAMVSLLTSWDGVDGATTAIDDSQFAHSPTFQGNAQIDTAQSVFGGASVLFGGVGDRVRWANHSAFEIGTQAFCIEGRIRFSNATGSSRQVVGLWDTAGGSPRKSWRVNFSPDALGGLALEYSTDGTTTLVGPVVSPGGGFATNTWYTWAFERDASDTLRGYWNGVMEDSAAISGEFASSTKDLVFGQDPAGSAQFLGWQDEVRLIVGAAPYASDSGYTPLGVPFPRS